MFVTAHQEELHSCCPHLSTLRLRNTNIHAHTSWCLTCKCSKSGLNAQPVKKQCRLTKIKTLHKQNWLCSTADLVQDPQNRTYINPQDLTGCIQQVLKGAGWHHCKMCLNLPLKAHGNLGRFLMSGTEQISVLSSREWEGQGWSGELQFSQPHLDPCKDDGATNPGNQYLRYEYHWNGIHGQNGFTKEKLSLTKLTAFYDEIIGFQHCVP